MIGIICEICMISFFRKDTGILGYFSHTNHGYVIKYAEKLRFYVTGALNIELSWYFTPKKTYPEPNSTPLSRGFLSSPSRVLTSFRRSEPPRSSSPPIAVLQLPPCCTASPPTAQSPTLTSSPHPPTPTVTSRLTRVAAIAVPVLPRRDVALLQPPHPLPASCHWVLRYHLVFNWRFVKHHLDPPSGGSR